MFTANSTAPDSTTYVQFGGDNSSNSGSSIGSSNQSDLESTARKVASTHFTVIVNPTVADSTPTDSSDNEDLFTNNTFSPINSPPPPHRDTATLSTSRHTLSNDREGGRGSLNLRNEEIVNSGDEVRNNYTRESGIGIVTIGNRQFRVKVIKGGQKVDVSEATLNELAQNTQALCDDLFRIGGNRPIFVGADRIRIQGYQISYLDKINNENKTLNFANHPITITVNNNAPTNLGLDAGIHLQLKTHFDGIQHSVGTATALPRRSEEIEEEDEETNNDGEIDSNNTHEIGEEISEGESAPTLGRGEKYAARRFYYEYLLKNKDQRIGIRFKGYKSDQDIRNEFNKLPKSVQQQFFKNLHARLNEPQGACSLAQAKDAFYGNLTGNKSHLNCKNLQNDDDVDKAMEKIFKVRT